MRISRLDAEERARGVVAASAGNHAQGVALAAQTARRSGRPCSCRSGAPLPKVAATRGYGADGAPRRRHRRRGLVAAQEFAERTGAVLIHPFDHVDIVAGQGTVGLEILEQCPDVRTVLVPAGGGGLLGGIAAAVQGAASRRPVVGVQAAGAAAYPRVAGRRRARRAARRCARWPTASRSAGPAT